MEKKRYESPLFTILLFVLIIFGFAVTIVDPFRLGAGLGIKIGLGDVHGINLVFLVVGVAMIITGVVIRFVAIASLGANFSGLLRIREGHTLIKTGIYHFIRHPAYLGAIILFLGIPVMLSSPLGFLAMLLLVPYLVHRIKLEEAMLVQRFGDEYVEYMKTSKRLIPGVY